MPSPHELGVGNYAGSLSDPAFFVHLPTDELFTQWACAFLFEPRGWRLGLSLGIIKSSRDRPCSHETVQLLYAAFRAFAY